MKNDDYRTSLPVSAQPNPASGPVRLDSQMRCRSERSPIYQWAWHYEPW